MDLKDRFRALRRDLKASLPYVRRREYRILQRRHEAVIESVGWSAEPAGTARLTALVAVAAPLVGEVCLFVSYCADPRLKRHVQAHVEQLLRAGVQVVLILNTDHPPEAFVLPDTLRQRLSGLLVRQNVGFDFAAWAHAYAQCGATGGWSRLYLVNDSIVGPLDDAAFRRLIERLRGASADLVGLTESQSPVPHVQSFFLVFNRSALQHPAVGRFFGRVLNLPTKDLVIDVYELRLTQALRRSGLRCEALFQPLGSDRHSANDTTFRWDSLIDAGFPFIKASMVRDLGTARIQSRVPAEFLDPDA